MRGPRFTSVDKKVKGYVLTELRRSERIRGDEGGRGKVVTASLSSLLGFARDNPGPTEAGRLPW